MLFLFCSDVAMSQAVRHCAEVDSAAAVSAVAAVAAVLTEAPTTATAAVKIVDRLLHRFVFL